MTMIVVRWLLWLMLAFAALPALAQSYMTTVTAQVKDANGTLYNSCRYSATLVNLSNSTLTLGGTALPDQFKQVTGTQCDASGNLSTKLVANTALIPNNSQWQFTICDSNGANCFNVQTTISGTTVNISALVQSAATILPIANTALLTGNYNYSGLNTFTFLRGRVDATQMVGADMCAKINAAWTYAVGLGLGYGDVDATGFHGRQDVATNCFASLPITPTAQQGFIGLLRLAPDVKIVTSVTQNPPSDVIVDGGSIWVWPVNTSTLYSSQMGAQFIASDTFNWATQKAVVTYGFAGGATNPRGIWLQNVGVNCISPNGTYTSGSIGIYNDTAQESSGGEGVFVNGCTVNIRQEVSGSFGGSQNSAPWKRITITSVGVPTSATGWVGFDYCSVSGNCAKSRGIDGASIAGPGAAGSVGVAVNAGGFVVRNISVENTTYGVELGKTHAALGVTLDNVDGQGHPTFNMTAVLHVAAGSVTSFTAFNITAASQQRTDYIIQDEGTGGLSLCGQSSVTVGSPCNGATKLTPVVTFYSCSFQQGYGVTRSCIWNTPEQQGFGTAGGVNNITTDLLLDATDFAQAVVMTPTTAAGLTATLPAAPPNKNWYTTLINGSNGFPLFINPNGVNLMGGTGTWTIAPQSACTIYTNGTSYYTHCGTSQNSLIVAPLVQNFTTSSGDQNITCRINGSVCPPGMYRITIHATVTVAGTAGTFQPYCGYTDQSSTAHNPVNATSIGLGNTSLTAVGNTYAGSCIVESKGIASNIKYGVSFAGATGTPSVRVNAAAERISIQ